VKGRIGKAAARVLPIFDWYILRQFLGTFLYALLILALVAGVIDYSQKVQDFVEHQAPGSEIARYYSNFIPHITAVLYPLFVFIACIFFTSRLAYRSELIAAIATGTTFPRLLRPYWIGGGLLALFSLWANHRIVPQANRERLRFEDRFVHDRPHSAPENIHLRLSPTLYVFMRSYDFASAQAYNFTVDELKGTELVRKTVAVSAQYDSARRTWTLRDAWVRTNAGLREKLEHHDSLVKPYRFTPRDITQNQDVMLAIPSDELRASAEQQRIRGSENLNFYLVELHRRSSQPASVLILTIIGVCIASRKVRGGSGLHLAIGVAISAAYILAMQFSTTLSTKGGLNPLVAVWIPNLLFAGLAAYLYRQRVK